MIKRFIRWFKIEKLARKLDPKSFERGSYAGKRQARKSAKAMFATAEGQYDAIGGKPWK